MKNKIKLLLFKWMFMDVAIQEFNVSIDDKYASATIIVQSQKSEMEWLYNEYIMIIPTKLSKTKCG